jgi:hypothetical protein
MTKETKQVAVIPKPGELHKDPVEAFKNDQLKTLLNQLPHKAWVKTNKFANNSEYLPIDKVEFLLDRIFKEWQVEVKETKQLFNSVQVTIRLHYKNPVNGVWYYHDGVAAKELQTQKGTGPLLPDFSNINAGAIEMAAPIAKSRAIKDAADHLGKLFGRDLNRKETVEYTADESLRARQDEIIEKQLKEAQNGNA